MTKINELPSTEKPRERLMHAGAAALSDSELLAILLNTGHKGYSSIDIANELLRLSEGVKQLKLWSLDELIRVKGIGYYKAIILKAAFELGERIHSGCVREQIKITKPADVANYMMGRMQHLTQEVFVVLFLNSKNVIIKERTLFKGTLNASVVHPREIFSEAVRCSAHAMIVLHNHPSGDVTPSKEDITTTERLIACGHVMGIALLDHIIIGDNAFISLTEAGYIESEI